MTTVLARLYDAMCAYIDCRQGDRTVDAHTAEFNTLYDRLLTIIPPTTDPVKKEEQQKMQIIVYYLRSLRPEFGPARTRVLNWTPAPTYVEVVEEIKRYEAYLEESVLTGARERRGNGGVFSNEAVGAARHGRTTRGTRATIRIASLLAADGGPKGNEHGSSLLHCS